MKFNLLKIAIRNMLKDRVYTFINVLGLTLGISFAFLLFLYVSHELSYDQHVSEAENVYRITADFTLDDHQDIFSNVPRPMGETLVREYPGIKASVRLYGYNGLQVHEGLLWNEQEDYIITRNAFLADSTYFKVFRLPLLEGDTATVLNHANSIVVSKSIAQKLYGTESALGKRVGLEEGREAIITGVFDDFNKPTHLPLDVLISYRTYFSATEDYDSWYGAHVYTYIRTTSTFKPADVNNHWKPFFEKYMKSTFDELNGTAEIILQPLTSLHLAPEYIWEPFPHGSKQNVYVFSLVGIFLLLVAGFNYMNLTLSRSLSRAKEVGVRKALGASRYGLSVQFIVESVTTALIASVISIAFAKAILPVFNQLIGEQLTLNFLTNPLMIIGILLIGICIGFMSGIYPAFHLSSLEAARVLKGGQSKFSQGNLGIRKVLVMVQQVISVSLIISTLVVIDQVNYVRKTNLGFDKDNLVLVDLRDETVRSNIKKFEHDLSSISGVENVTRMNDVPLSGINEFSIMVEKPNGEFESAPTQIIEVSDNYLETMNIELLAGRTFVEADSFFRSILINVYQAELLGYETAEDAVGARFKFPGEDEEHRTIIGVVNNFRMVSASEPLKSLCIAYYNGGRRFMGIRIHSKNQSETLQAIEKMWKSYGASYPFQYTFMDEQLDNLLGKEDRLYRLMVFGSALIILVSCLGLFGLVSFTALQRSKEIGIRKVLGATNSTLYFTLVKDFFTLLAAAFIVSVAISWYFGNSWLQNFVLRTNFDWVNLLIAAIVALLITGLTLSYHTQKVIRANPVDSLKEE
ncbi:ABC transporter permease [Fulvivirga sp. 29W222]|uniref:ABC transporter permease n=1 Tax=Fulvivirga marina TaxID=2494733 RepID=A0A937G553_9BACT|nr:ABC transporter permease [Fulvivirga marina]MBL6448601.1 ABC transporter permease [Fulvivirga marina]